jgi:hypothetical protein
VQQTPIALLTKTKGDFEMAEQNSTPDLDRETLEAANRFWSSLAKVDDTVIGRAIREKAEPEAWRAGRS